MTPVSPDATEPRPGPEAEPKPETQPETQPELDTEHGSRPGAESGLTLLELLVALTVTALLVSLVGVGLGTGFDTADRLRVRAIDTLDRRALDAALRDDLGRALAIVDLDDRDGALRLDGSAALLALLVPGPSGPVPRRITIDAEGLLSIGGRFGGDLTFDLGPGARFAYFGAVSDREDATWHDEWRHRRELPRLIRLELPGRAAIHVAPRTERAPFR